MESLCQKLVPGVVLNFRKVGYEEDNNTASAGSRLIERNKQIRKLQEQNIPPNSNGRDLLNGLKEDSVDRGVSPIVALGNEWHNTIRMIYVKSNPKTSIPTGHWPIPETFWPDLSNGTLVTSTCTIHVFTFRGGILFYSRFNKILLRACELFCDYLNISIVCRIAQLSHEH